MLGPNKRAFHATQIRIHPPTKSNLVTHPSKFRNSENISLKSVICKAYISFSWSTFGINRYSAINIFSKFMHNWNILRKELGIEVHCQNIFATLFLLDQNILELKLQDICQMLEAPQKPNLEAKYKLSNYRYIAHICPYIVLNMNIQLLLLLAMHHKFCSYLI